MESPTPYAPLSQLEDLIRARTKGCEIVASGSPESLKAEVGGDVVQIALNGAADGPDDALNGKAEGLVRQQGYVQAVHPVDGGIAVTVENGSAAVPDLVGLLHAERVSVGSLSVVRPTLDDVFLKHTGRAIRAEETTSEFSDTMRQSIRLRRR